VEIRDTGADDRVSAVAVTTVRTPVFGHFEVAETSN
jgi:hypothetical protein